MPRLHGRLLRKYWIDARLGKGEERGFARQQHGDSLQA